jgi:hypothetical protein
MFMAAFIALFQTNAKRILAYSSISQMGYILMGVGCAAYLGYEGAMGLAGTAYHIMNHAFFKAGMFMMVGAVYARTHELELSRLGGLYLDFPVTALAFLVCACGIAGVPGFNGYASKTLLHHAIVEAYEHHHAVSLYWAEKIFTLTSAFTVCYITKLYTSIFFGPRPFGLKRLAGEPLLEKAVFGIMAVGIIIMGLFPSAMLKRFIEPAAHGFIYDGHGVEHLLHLNIWTRHDLQGIAVALGLGLLFFVLFSRSGAFSYRPPGWLSVEYLIYQPVTRLGGLVYTFSGRIVDITADGFFVKGIPPLVLVSRKVAFWDDCLDPYLLQPALKTMARLYTGGARFLDSAAEGILVESRRPLIRFSNSMYVLDSVVLVGLGGKLLLLGKFFREFFYGFCFRIIKFCMLLGRGYGRRAFLALIKMDYDYKGEEFYHYFNILNFDFDFILLFVVLVSVLVIGLVLI